jgi:type VI protein secretion system component Hcp
VGHGLAARVDNFTVVKRVDAGTPKFMQCLVGNRRIRKVTTAFRKAGLQADGSPSMDFFIVTLEDVFVVGWQPAGLDGEAPLERITFNFRKFKVTYRMQKQDGTPEGTIETQWDAAAHR